MKKIVLLAFVLVLLSMSMFGTRLVVTVSGSTIHDVYPGDSIQEAINLAALGDTIFVHNGIYYEHVVINKSISLIGENRSTTVIDGGGAGDVIVIDITTNYVNLAGFTIRNGTKGIIIKYSDNNIISGNIVTDNQNGIYLYSTCTCNPEIENTIRNNVVKNNGVGISLGTATNNDIYHNNFINNTQQVYIRTTSYTNSWDDGYPSGGNYWSNYGERYPDAEELDGSGIWNTTYVIDGNNKDNYPLMNPWVYVSPVADAGPDQSVFQGVTVTFDASGSTDDVTIKSYVWNFTDVTPKTLTGIHPQYTFKNVGNFTVTLNVTDYADKWDTDTMWVNVSADANKPSIGTVFPEPVVPGEWEKVTITVNVTDGESGVQNVTISYRTNSGPWINTSMSKLTEETWEGEIPGQPSGTNVTYKIIAYDKAGNFEIDPQLGQYYIYTVIPEFPTWTSMLLILIMLTVAIAIHKRKLLKTPTH